MVTSASGNLSALEQRLAGGNFVAGGTELLDPEPYPASKQGWATQLLDSPKRWLEKQNHMIAILLYIIIKIRSSKWWLLDGI